MDIVGNVQCCYATVLLMLWMPRLCVVVTGHGSHSKPTHVHGGERPSGIHDPKVVHDKEHIQEHYDGKVDLNDTEMSPEELEFHYFKLHDFDNNTKLDGLEILKALTHLLPFQDDSTDMPPSTEHQTTDDKIQSQKDKELKYYMDIVDSVLDEDDLDQDGYLTYLEYVLARKREEAREANYDKDRYDAPQPKHKHS